MRRHSDGCDGIFACSQALARKANAEGRLVTIFDVGEFKYIDDVEALALLGPLALTSLAGIRKKHLPLLHRINIDGARVRFVARAGCAQLLGFADGWTLVCLYGGGGHQATPNACCVCCRVAFGRVRRVRRR